MREKDGAPPCVYDVKEIKSPKGGAPGNLGILVEALGRERACVYFPGEDYVYVLNAEKDPN